MASRVQEIRLQGAALNTVRDEPGRIGGLIARLRERTAFRFRRWREYRQIEVELRYLDHRQLKEFGIDRRPPELTESRFP